MHIQKRWLARSAMTLAVLAFSGHASRSEANAAGIGGYSGREGFVCTDCHVGTTPASVQIIDDETGTTAPSAIPRGETRAFRVRVTGGPAVVCGFNLAADGGVLTPGAGVQLWPFLAGEITHTAAKPFSAGVCDLPFSWTAPDALGNHEFYVAGNSANANTNELGDAIGLDTHSITVIDPANAPANDDSSAAVDLPNRASLFATLVDATPDGSDSSGTSTNSGDVWYRWTAPSTGTLTVSTCGTHDAPNGVSDIIPDGGTDTVVSLHGGAPGTSANELAVNDDFPNGPLPTKCNAVDVGFQRDSAVTASVPESTVVYIRVAHHSSSARGTFFLRVAPEPGSAVTAAAAVATLAACTRRLRRRRAS